MEIIILYIVAALIIGCILYAIHLDQSGKSKKEKTQYKYQTKEYFMTKAEGEFFRMLVDVTGDKYFVFPQAHLSAILDEKVVGQNWSAAFSHINGKSVDFVLCDKTTLKPAYAIELDDYTHQSADRQERDKEVERMLQDAGIILVRFSDYRSLDEKGIVMRFAESKI